MEYKDYDQPSLVHAEPVLAVRDVLQTVSYWHDVLGFPEKWTWGEPPNHGGVSWQGTAFVQFSLNPEVAARSQGHSVWFRVRQLEKLYALHVQNKAKIVAPMENKPWGMAEYIVQDINGYYLSFSAPVLGKQHTEQKMPGTIRIIERAPTASEFRELARAVGWSASEDDSVMEVQLRSTVFALVAEDQGTRKVVGCAFLLGDNNGIFYVKDVIVHPTWQGKRIGTALMRELTNWLEAKAPNHATVGLFTGEHLAPFYRQFGFTQACGMYRQIERK